MRILVIEDYTPLKNAVTEFLHESGFSVDSSGTGDEGLWFAQNHNYDLIVLDIMLPNIDGLSLLKQLRTEQNNTPVIITSAKDSVMNKVKGLETGANDYLVKPFDLDELLARIRVQIRTSYQVPSDLITVGKLEINIQSKRVSCESNEIQLTAKEYNLLEYLAYRKSEAVSRSDIWEHAYQDGEGGSSNVVDVYIGYLRKKLKIHGVDHYIVTRRGSSSAAATCADPGSASVHG